MLVLDARTKLILGENDMEVFAEYLAQIDNPQHRDRTEEVLAWVTRKFPNLSRKLRGISLCLPIMAHLLLALA